MQKTNIPFHLQCRPEDIGRYCLLPGDPGRCEAIAAYFDNPRFVSSNREFTVYSGTLLGVPVSVCSTGIGGPSAAIAMEELHDCGADTFLRVGTCGGIQLDVKSGDIVIATGAVRFDHTGLEYAPIEYPAVPSYDVLSALHDAAVAEKASFHMGVVQCKDSFYGQHEPERMPASAMLIEKWNAWKRLGVKASEMESAALFVIADSLGCRCGACFHVIWNQEREKAGLDQSKITDTSKAVKLGIDAIKRLIEKDTKTADAAKR